MENEQPEVEAIRRFNRFYTRQIGVLQEGLLRSPFSLAEVRVLYEVAHRTGPTAAEIAKALALDGGYLSRILRRFAARRLISRTPSETDARQAHVALTARGRATLAPLEQRSREEVAAMLGRVPSADRARVVEAMRTLESCLGDRETPRVPYILRPHQPGDLGWIVHRHGALYTQEYGWNAEFEALVAEIAAHFLRTFDASRERCWIAERDGAIAGSVMLVRQSDRIAKLRLLLVEPSARGLGIGRRLVEECIRFARQAGYRKITLWTQANLTAARGIYQAVGFRLVKSEPRPAFGKPLVSETWELPLAGAASGPVAGVPAPAKMS